MNTPKPRPHMPAVAKPDQKPAGAIPASDTSTEMTVGGIDREDGLSMDETVAAWEANTERLDKVLVPLVERLLAEKFGSQVEPDGHLFCSVDHEWFPTAPGKDGCRSKVQVTFDPEHFDCNDAALQHAERPTTTDWIDLWYKPAPETSEEAILAAITEDLLAITIRSDRAVEPVEGEILTLCAPEEEFTGCVIEAKVCSGDGMCTEWFDAERFFRVASDRELVDLMLCEWKDGDAADKLALYMADHDKTVMRALEHTPWNTRFACEVIPEGAIAWMREHRPHLIPVVDLLLDEDGNLSGSAADLDTNAYSRERRAEPVEGETLTLCAPKAGAKECVIDARVRSDDGGYDEFFDAERFFKVASDRELVNLMLCEWKGDYASDEVAIYMADHDKTVARVFEYISAVGNAPGRRGAMGFECEVFPESAIPWIREHRPYLNPVIDLLFDEDGNLSDSVEIDTNAYSRERRPEPPTPVEAHLQTILEQIQKDELVVYGESSRRMRSVNLGSGVSMEIQYHEDGQEIHEAVLDFHGERLPLDEKAISILCQRF